MDILSLLLSLDPGTAISVFVGAMIGWHVPEPAWAKALWAYGKKAYTKAKEKVLSLIRK